MGQRIESDKLLVKDLFTKWFRIPEYQRPYVWETDQVVELLEDVYQARNSNQDSQYFLGSMVLKKSEKVEGDSHYEEFDLLDGQQRLTTLFLITAVIRDLTPIEKTARRDTCIKTIYQMANPDDSIPERLRIVFDIRDKVRDFVNEYVKQDGHTGRVEELEAIRNRKDEDISIKNMANAILTIRNYFQNGHSIDDFFPYLRSNVLMIYVAAEELEDAFHLFTVMNSRGVKLRNSDILKAENLAKVEDDADRSNYAGKWESIEAFFGENFDNFLSHLRTILVKQKAGYNLLKEFEENIYAPKEYDRNTKVYTPKQPLLSKGKDTFRFIERYYAHYMSLFENDNYSITQSFEVANYLKLMMTGFEADYWIAPVLRYYDKFKTAKLPDFLKKLDRKFSADWVTSITPTTRVENINAIIKQIDEAKTVDDVLNSSAFDISRGDFERIVRGGVYGRRYAKYLMLKIDLLYHGHTTKFSPPDMISIEHILPQNPPANSQWHIDFNKAQRQEWTDKLGNLTLISRRKNASQSNRDYSVKKTNYFLKNIELFANSIRIINKYTTWTAADLQKNQEDVVKRLIAEY